MFFDPITTLLGRPVEDRHGETVGRVDDLLIDCADGQIAYVRFIFHAGDGPESPRLTVPWSAIRVAGNGDKTVQITVGQETLRRLAGAGSGQPPIHVE